jgi:hypothetical protein
LAKPWDPLPFPNRGDLDVRATYEALGRLVHFWEEIDFQLARIYSIMVGDPDGDALREYGSGRNIPEKLVKLRKAADEQWFKRKPNQRREGEWDRLLDQVEGFAERRNEFAHGLVYPLTYLTLFRERTDLPDYLVQYGIIPGYQTLKRYSASGIPSFMYTSENMTTLQERMTLLFAELADFQKILESE